MSILLHYLFQRTTSTAVPLVITLAVGESYSFLNENLLQQLQCLYQDQFGAPEAANGVLFDICDYYSGRIAVSEISTENYFSTENMLPSKQGFMKASGLPTTEYTPACLPGHVLISNIRPYFKKIVLCSQPGGCSADVLCFAPTSPIGSPYLYSTLYADRFFDYMVAGSKGTKMPRGDKQQIMQYPVHIPTDKEYEAFHEVAQPILSLVAVNEQEEKRLSSLRDALLPRLMSGELDVSSIDI